MLGLLLCFYNVASIPTPTASEQIMHDCSLETGSMQACETSIVLSALYPTQYAKRYVFASICGHLGVECSLDSIVTKLNWKNMGLTAFPAFKPRHSTSNGRKEFNYLSGLVMVDVRENDINLGLAHPLSGIFDYLRGFNADFYCLLDDHGSTSGFSSEYFCDSVIGLVPRENARIRA